MSELGSGNGSSYPGSLDTDSVLESASTLARADVPNDSNSAIVAIETELGTDPAGSTANVKTFLQTEHDADGTHQAASATFAGVVELATAAEVTTGTDTGRVAAVSTMGAHEGVAKAWVNFNGEGTVAIRSSYNVSSIGDLGVGQYTMNWDTDFADINYACAVTAGQTAINATTASYDSYAAGTTGIQLKNDAGTNVDRSIITAIAMGDQ